MRRTLLAAAAVIGLAAGSAHAQTYGRQAQADTSPEQFLQTAQDAIARRQGWAAREALERAETRLLDRSVAPSMVNQPDSNPRVQQIAEARRAVERGDFNAARQLISQAMSGGSAGGMGSDSMGAGNMGPGGMSSGGMSSGGMSSGGMGHGGTGSGGMGPGGMSSGQSPALGSSVPGQASPRNEGTGMDSQMPMRR